MINITREAAAQILASAQLAGDSEFYLRFAARFDSKGVIEYGMGLDAKAEGDLIEVSQGISVLVAPGCVELLTGATLDYVEIQPGVRKFIFFNPNDPAHRPPAAGVPTPNPQGPPAGT